VRMDNLLELFSSMEPSLKVQFLAALLASLLVGVVLGACLSGAFGIKGKYILSKRLHHKHERQRTSQEAKEIRIEFYQDIILSFEEHYSRIYDEKSGIPRLIRQGYRKHIHVKIKRKLYLADKKIRELHNQIMMQINRKSVSDEELALMAIELFNEIYDQLEND
jgi:hypothetical protein